MNYNFIRIEQEEFVCTLTLARAEKRNAFTPMMISEIAHVVNEVNRDETIKLLVIRADGPVFCSGMDLKTFYDPSLDVRHSAIPLHDISLGEVMSSLRKPSVAVVEGDVIAGGFLLILGCTYVLAEEKVRFRLPELGLGIFPFQVMESLLKVMPEKHVLQLCLDTEYFGVDKAMHLRIVDRYYTPASLTQLIRSFENIQTDVLVEGLSALHDIREIPQGERFKFLKERLEALRNRKQQG
ncbi:enoyl-CoA hydratase/isomerase family protein [Sphingobacterium suaedae]|uniref:Enoyl-CoA hydratase/isomerase family protein n=1 Tax=Sphingobacterium suaedae TaxID=1686402 RepID=A0ABW5KEN2_9SPHI